MPDREHGGESGGSVTGHETPLVFVAFADDDAAWTNGYLIPALGLAHGEVITPHDFTPEPACSTPSSTLFSHSVDRARPAADTAAGRTRHLAR
jgi:hypothetical protein